MTTELEEIQRDCNIKTVEPVENADLLSSEECYILWISSVTRSKNICEERTVKIFMSDIYKDTMANEIALIDQYKKELDDLSNRIGIAEIMNPYDIEIAINRLQAAIVDKEKKITYYANLIKDYEV